MGSIMESQVFRVMPNKTSGRNAMTNLLELDNTDLESRIKGSALKYSRERYGAPHELIDLEHKHDSGEL